MSADSATPATTLLGPDDPAPVHVLRPHGTSDLLLLVDHAGRAVPASLGRLGVPEAEFERHIAWDIGALGVTMRLTELLDAVAITQAYSRLVIDCNRRPGHPTSVAPRSDGTDVPANRSPDPAAVAARVGEIFAPYQAAIAVELDARAAAGRRSVLVAVHSFTPVMAGRARPWHVGVLYNHDPRYGRALLRRFEQEGDLVVGDNEPYCLSDLDDYTVPVHGEQRGLLHIELEIRQDLIASPEGQASWADRLARLLPLALVDCASEERSDAS